MATPRIMPCRASCLCASSLGAFQIRKQAPLSALAAHCEQISCEPLWGVPCSPSPTTPFLSPRFHPQSGDVRCVSTEVLGGALGHMGCLMALAFLERLLRGAIRGGRRLVSFQLVLHGQAAHDGGASNTLVWYCRERNPGLTKWGPSLEANLHGKSPSRFT